MVVPFAKVTTHKSCFLTSKIDHNLLYLLLIFKAANQNDD